MVKRTEAINRGDIIVTVKNDRETVMVTRDRRYLGRVTLTPNVPGNGKWTGEIFGAAKGNGERPLLDSYPDYTSRVDADECLRETLEQFV